ncbi:MAG TPA: glycogen-binding domain-containing protein [Gemmatimonadaceae bacterium]|jgi:hypothetical protein|nr:glycogen-binding domain-containing protein [Gemmatimonadaceae bacterium]
MRRVREFATLATVLSLAFPELARAQWQASADAGLSHLRQTGIPESVAQTLAGTIDGIGSRAWLHAVGLASLQPNNARTEQALAMGGIFGTIVDPVRWELGGAFSAFNQSGVPITTTSGELNARLRFGGPLGGVSLGGGAGTSANSFYNVRVGRGSLDAWWTAGRERLLAGAMVTHIGSTQYTDFAAGWRHDAGAASIGATAALRAGDGSGGWQAADAELWVSSRLAVVLAAGTALSDVVRGTPSTRYASASLRVAWQPHVALRFRRDTNAGVRVVISRSGSGEGIARIDVSGSTPGMARVELMADFTGWEPIVLTRAGDGWFAERAVTPGLHRLAIRVDGGAWIAPFNVPKLRDDDLGGTVGLITVP